MSKMLYLCTIAFFAGQACQLSLWVFILAPEKAKWNQFAALVVYITIALIHTCLYLLTKEGNGENHLH